MPSGTGQIATQFQVSFHHGAQCHLTCTRAGKKNLQASQKRFASVSRHRLVPTSVDHSGMLQNSGVLQAPVPPAGPPLHTGGKSCYSLLLSVACRDEIFIRTKVFSGEDFMTRGSLPGKLYVWDQMENQEYRYRAPNMSMP